MSLIEAIVLGIVQGLAEFLPISSSGHLILTPWLLGWKEHGLTFDLALHLGTSAALLGYFWRDWLRLAQAVLSGLTSAQARASHEWRLAWLIVLGCIPAGVVGVLFEDKIEELLRSPLQIAVLLIVFGLIMLAADRLGSQQRRLNQITLADALTIGFAQVLALMPGVSRSGITLTAGLFRGLDRASAARFSFLLSAPITVAAALYKLRGLVKAPPVGGELLAFAVGVVTAAVVGALAIGFLLRYLQRQPVDVFVWYRVAAGLVVLALVLMGK
ncbi:MAG: undecaprenyl-diphosphatase UppP [Chloroflexi bacterium]|nr:undecaprenyl-diphosphatase UppP [Chloroflexota bacterium]